MTIRCERCGKFVKAGDHELLAVPQPFSLDLPEQELVCRECDGEEHDDG